MCFLFKWWLYSKRREEKKNEKDKEADRERKRKKGEKKGREFGFVMALMIFNLFTKRPFSNIT